MRKVILDTVLQQAMSNAGHTVCPGISTHPGMCVDFHGRTHTANNNLSCCECAGAMHVFSRGLSQGTPDIPQPPSH